MLNSVSCSVECWNRPFNMLNAVERNRDEFYSIKQVATCWTALTNRFPVSSWWHKVQQRATCCPLVKIMSIWRIGIKYYRLNSSWCFQVKKKFKSFAHFKKVIDRKYSQIWISQKMADVLITVGETLIKQSSRRCCLLDVAFSLRISYRIN